VFWPRLWLLNLLRSSKRPLTKRTYSIECNTSKSLSIRVLIRLRKSSRILTDLNTCFNCWNSRSLISSRLSWIQFPNFTSSSPPRIIWATTLTTTFRCGRRLTSTRTRSSRRPCRTWCGSRRARESKAPSTSWKLRITMRAGWISVHSRNLWIHLISAGTLIVVSSHSSWLTASSFVNARMRRSWLSLWRVSRTSGSTMSFVFSPRLRDMTGWDCNFKTFKFRRSNSCQACSLKTRCTKPGSTNRLPTSRSLNARLSTMWSSSPCSPWWGVRSKNTRKSTKSAAKRRWHSSRLSLLRSSLRPLVTNSPRIVSILWTWMRSCAKQSNNLTIWKLRLRSNPRKSFS